MPSQTTEKAFEDAIIHHLRNSGGYKLGDPANFSKDLALDRTVLLQFVRASQPQAWQKLAAIHGLTVESKFIQRLYQELEFRGMLDVLRNGITDYGVRFKLAYFKPASGLNPETLALYNHNILTVTRQVHYSNRNKNSIDLLLSINGLPVATVELKNHFTGQDVENAKQQYGSDRENHELLFQFKRRALVHFAVDPDEAWMTTRIDGNNTRFLPFNQGYNKGAGNPPNRNGHRTAYLWETIWAKDSWLDIVGRFLHLEQDTITLNGKTVKKESLIFPRFHQLDVVRKLTTDAKTNGAGHNYLIQHSAGSGKSNSIAWLAYQLANLYDDRDTRVFDSVIVITDRRILDRQLQDTIYQFDHVAGVVQKVDRNASQLAEALTAGTNIIITTLQKFPFVLDKIGELPQRNYALMTKAIEDDPQIHKKKASKAIARFLSLHPHNLAQKTEIIIEHFRQCVMPKIGGKAKAMLVTASRPHVIRYKDEFDRYLNKQGYEDIKAIVAFTAFTDRETGISYTESDINGFGERELPEKFDTLEYQMLIVADKYQTGFDQPLLHTMYVDKKLAGVKAVQTLSRLNRICPGKEETFVLDFANEEQEIIDAFQPYYEQTILAATTNPNRLYDLKNRIDSFHLIWTSEVDAFARVFFKPTERTSRQDHARLNAIIDPACDRFTGLEEEQQDEFKNTLTTFIRLYAFLSQIMPFADEELEKFYAFTRLLQTKLPKQLQSEIFKLTDEVGLEYYRLQKVREGQIILQKDSGLALQPSTEAGMPKDKESQAKLSEIIYLLNKRFNPDFTDADKYFFSQIEEELIRNELLCQQVKSNSIQNLKYSFNDIFNATLIERMEDNQDISIKIFDDREFGDAVRDWMLKKVYDRLTEEPQSS
jgi:type I site-specific restriction-modification system R (restriction) subunit